MSRGQGVTTFIILGMLIMLGMVAYLALSGISDSIPTLETKDGLLVRSFVSSCIQETGSFGLFALGRQGGYIEEPPRYHWEPYGAIGYAFYDTEKTFLSVEEMENNLAMYIQGSLPDCLNNFEEIRGQGIHVQARHISVDVLFTQKTVDVMVEYPLNIKEGGSTKKLSNFRERFSVRMLHLYNIADKLMSQKISHPDFLDITYLNSIDVNTTILTEEDGDQIIIFQDEESTLKELPYKFMIATGGDGI